MSSKTYLKIEKSIFEISGRIGYLAVFVLLGSLLMTIINILLYCFIDNYSLVKFIFTGEMKFSEWFSVMYKSYEFPYIRIGLFAVIFLIVGIYRSNGLIKKPNK